MRGDLHTRSVVKSVITKMILCVTAAKRNLISRFVAIDLVNELSRQQLHLLLFCSAFRGLYFTGPALIKSAYLQHSMRFLDLMEFQTT